jgi:hypothetical protein
VLKIFLKKGLKSYKKDFRPMHNQMNIFTVINISQSRESISLESFSVVNKVKNQQCAPVQLKTLNFSLLLKIQSEIAEQNSKDERRLG